MKLNKFLIIIIEESLLAVSGFLVLSFLLEWRFPYVISGYLNLNYLIVLWLMLGTILLVGKKSA